MIADNKVFLEKISFGNMKVDTSETHKILFHEITTDDSHIPTGEEMADRYDEADLKIQELDE